MPSANTWSITIVRRASATDTMTPSGTRRVSFARGSDAWKGPGTVLFLAHPQCHPFPAEALTTLRHARRQLVSG